MIKISSIISLPLGLTFALLLSLNTFANSEVASISKYSISKQEVEFATKMAGLGDKRNTESNKDTSSQFDSLPIESKKLIATRLLNQKILESLAKKEKLDKLPEVEFATRSILAAEYVKKHSPNINEIAKNKYDEMVSNLKDKKTYTLSHILVKDETEAIQLKKETEFTTNKQHKHIQNKHWKQTFKHLAKTKSIDTATAKNDGHVGSVPETKLPSDFLSNIRNHKVNTLIGPFKTHLGYHVVYIEKIDPIHIEPYNKVQSVFINQVLLQQEADLAKEATKGKEVRFGFATKKA